MFKLHYYIPDLLSYLVQIEVIASASLLQRKKKRRRKKKKARGLNLYLFVWVNFKMVVKMVKIFFSCVWNTRYVTGHIWACPPSEGDDYIFHCHPPDQKIPKPKRLQEWYKKMLDKAFAERIIHDYKVCYCLLPELIFLGFSFEGS